MVGAQGVLLDQGQQAVRVGTADITLLTAGSERVRITSSGNVGIGTDNPVAALDVTGSAIVVGTSSATSGVKQALISESNNNSSAKWWLLASGSCASSDIGYLINISGSFGRANEGDVGIDLVFSVNYGYMNVAKSII